MDWWYVPRQYLGVWKDRRYRYGAVLPVWALMAALGIGALSSGQPVIGVIVAISPVLIVAFITVVVWWADWLDGEVDA